MTYDAKETSVSDGEPIEVYRIVSGSATYRYTSADVLQTVDVAGDGPQDFAPEAIRRNSLGYSDEDGSGQLEVTVPRWNDIAVQFIAYSPPWHIGINIYRYHAGDAEIVVAFTGKVITAKFTDSEATLICAPTSAILKRTIPRANYQSQCNWPLYSPPCGVNRDAYRVSAIVLTTSGNDVTASAFGSKPSGYFKNGWLQLPSGERRYIVAHAGNVVTLMSPFFGITTGTDLFAFPGCERTEADCKNRYNNLANHLGFPRVPARNVFVTGIE